MQLTKGAIGNLINRYKAVLKKCHLLNVFGSLAVAGMLVMGGAGVAAAADVTWKDPSQDMEVKAGDTLNIAGTLNPTTGSLSIAGGTVNITAPLNVDYNAVNNPTGRISMTGGTLNVKNSYAQVLGIDVDGGTVNVTDGDGSSLTSSFLLSYAGNKVDGEWSKGWDTTFSNATVNLNAGTIFGAFTAQGGDYLTSLVFDEGTKVNMTGASLDKAGVIYASAYGPDSENHKKGVQLVVTGKDTEINATGHGLISAGKATLSDGARINVANNGQLDLAAFISKNTAISTALESLPEGYGTFDVTSGASVNVAEGGTLNIHNVKLDVDGGNIANAGVINLSHQGMLHVDSSQYTDLLQGEKAQVNVGTGTSLVLTHDQGGTVDLTGKLSGTAADGKISLADGSTLAVNTATVLNEAAFDINANASFRSLEAGTEEAGFTIKQGTVSIIEGLTVAGKKGLTIATGGTLKLDAQDAQSGTITAAQTTVNGGTLSVASGTWNAETLTVEDGKVDIAGATLKVSDLTTKDTGRVNLTELGSALESNLAFAEDGTVTNIAADSLSSVAGSEVTFTGLDNVSKDQAVAIKGLFTDSKGVINLGDAVIEEVEVTDGKVSYDAWKTNGFTTNAMKEATLTDVHGNVTQTGSFGSAQLAEGEAGLNIGISGTDNTNSLTLTGLDASDTFASTSDEQAADVTVFKNATLVLGDNAYTGNKSIGKIKLGDGAALKVLGAGSDATVNSGAITTTQTGTTVEASRVTLNVSGNIGDAAHSIANVTANAANIVANGDVYAGNVTLANGVLTANEVPAAAEGAPATGGNITVDSLAGQGAVVADNTLTVNNAYVGADTDALALQANVLNTSAGFDSTEGTVAIEAAQWNASGLTTLKGDTVVLTEAGNFTGAFSMDGGAFVAQSEDADAPATLTFSDGATFTNGASVLADSISMGVDKTLSVGSAADTIGGTTLSARHINLNRGMLLVDPAWGLTSSNVAVESLSATTAADDITVNGSVGVGQNAYLALGTADTGWLPGVVAGYTSGVGLSETGITAALGVFKGIQIADGENLTVDGSKAGSTIANDWTAAGAANTATFADNSLLVINGADAGIATGGAAISFAAATSGPLTVAEGAKLLVTDAVAGQDYTIVGNVNNVTGVTPEGALPGWKNNGMMSTTDMISLGDAVFTPGTGATTGKVTTSAERNDAHTVFPNLSDGMANAVNDLYTGHDGAAGEPRWDYADVNSADMGVRFLSRATDNRFLGADKDAAASTIESAARIAFAGAVPQMTKMASDAGSNAVVNRLGFANPADGAQAMDAEGKIVDRNTTGFALWIAPLWQNQHGWGMEADNLDYGFNGNLGGVSLGADYTFENAIRAGITFNIGGGYAESSGGDLNSTENRMSFWGLGAYAGWNYENFGLMADVSYTSTWNDLKQDMDSRMGMGDLEADVQASAISAGLRAEYKLETSVLDVIPHIGVRYMSLNTWGFDAESNGGTVLEGDGFHQDIWTFPVGVTFTKDFTLDSGWSFKPSIDFSVIPAAGDIKAKQDVAFTGLPGSYEVETQMMDYLTWQGGVGLEMGNDTMSFGVNYTLQAGQHTTGHGVFGSFRYEF